MQYHNILYYTILNQEGFGWSNGVILDLLSTFPKLTLPQNLVEVTVEADAVVSVSKLS